MGKAVVAFPIVSLIGPWSYCHHRQKGDSQLAKRSNFRRRPQDAYHTIDPKAVAALLPHLNGTRTFAEPCYGEGHLCDQLIASGLTCVLGADIDGGIDALQLPNFNGADAIITNPPWSRPTLHKMIAYFSEHAPTWLLFDSDWAYNAHARPYLNRCSDIVVVGRLRWIEGTKQTGKDNVSWYRFDARHSGPTVFHGRMT
jgi:hypothetical protein